MTRNRPSYALSFLCWMAFLYDFGLSFSPSLSTAVGDPSSKNRARLHHHHGYDRQYSPKAHISISLSSSTRNAAEQQRERGGRRRPSRSAARPIRRKEGDRRRLSRREINNAMNSIWRHTTNQPLTNKSAETALKLLAKLLEEEERTGEPILKQGAVFNVLKACRHLGPGPSSSSSSSSSRTTATLLEKTMRSLEENERLWDDNMVPYAIGLLTTKVKSHSSMVKAESLLRGMEEDAATDAAASANGKEEGSSSSASARLVRRPYPSLFTYTTMLRCYANRGMADKAEDLLSRMHELYESGRLDREPDRVALKCVRDAHRRAKSLNRRQAENATEAKATEKFAPSVLDSSVADSLDNDSLQSAVNTIWYHIRKDPDKSKGAKKALLLLNRLLAVIENEKNHEQHVGVVNTSNVVFNVLRACSRHTSDIDVDDLETTHQLLESNEGKNLTNAKIFRELLVAVTKCPDDNDRNGDASAPAPDRAEDMLKRTKSVALNSYHHNAVMMGYAKRGWAHKAERLLKEMQALQKAGSITDGPNTITYNVVLDALAKSGESDAVKRAELIWKKMMKNAGIKPDMFTFSSLFSLYAQNGQGDKAERLLEQVVKLHKAGKLKGDGPNAFTYRCVIDALAKQSGSAAPGAPERAEEILYRMKRESGIDPNRFHYCGVLGAYARNGKADQCERLLRRMYDSHVAGNGLPDPPDVVAYNSVVYAWANSGADDALSKARGIVDDMIEAGVKPNVITYNCLLPAAKDGKEAEQMLKHMTELHDRGELDSAPNIISYNYCLNALAKSEVDWTVVRAESLITEMTELYQSGKEGYDTKPNMITYRSLLKCYAKWNLAEDAERLLRKMQSMYKKGKLDYGPDKVSFNLVIDLLRKSNEDGSTERAENLQKQVEEIYGVELVSDSSRVRQPDQVDAILEYMGGFGYPSFL